MVRVPGSAVQSAPPATRRALPYLGDPCSVRDDREGSNNHTPRRLFARRSSMRVSAAAAAWKEARFSSVPGFAEVQRGTKKNPDGHVTAPSVSGHFGTSLLGPPAGKNFSTWRIRRTGPRRLKAVRGLYTAVYLSISIAQCEQRGQPPAYLRVTFRARSSHPVSHRTRRMQNSPGEDHLSHSLRTAPA